MLALGAANVKRKPGCVRAPTRPGSTPLLALWTHRAAPEEAPLAGPLRGPLYLARLVGRGVGRGLARMAFGWLAYYAGEVAAGKSLVE